jgi:glycosyltransferase involved in cell wall biosynthesis
VTSFFLKLLLFRQLGFTKPIIFEVQGFGTPEAARTNLYNAKPFVDNNANALLYPSTPHIGDLLRQLYPNMPKFAFANPFDPDAFSGPQLDPLPFTPLVWIGRLEDNKNWRDFLSIGRQVVNIKPEVRLLMFSDPDVAVPGENEQLMEMSEALGLSNHIIHHHNIPREHMPAYYSQIAASGGSICMTSKAEGAPYVALEALICGCPVVTSNSDGVRSAIIDEVTGLYYTHGDIDGAARQIIRVITNRKLRRTLAEKGKKHVRSDFSMEKYATHFSDMLLAVGAKPC